MRISPRLPLATALVALPLIGAITANAAPGGSVARYQVTSTSYTVMVLGTYEHDYTVTTNPCDGSVSIAGSTPVNSGYYTTETITGALSNGVVSYTSSYDGPYSPGYSYN